MIGVDCKKRCQESYKEPIWAKFLTTAYTEIHLSINVQASSNFTKIEPQLLSKKVITAVPSVYT